MGDEIAAIRVAAERGRDPALASTGIPSARCDAASHDLELGLRQAHAGIVFVIAVIGPGRILVGKVGLGRTLVADHVAWRSACRSSQWKS